LRLVRAASVSAVVLGLAGAAHVAGHGELPRPGILVALAAFVALVTMVATRRLLSLPALVGLLVATQVVLHQAMTWLSVPACAALVTAADPHAAHQLTVGSGLGCAVAGVPMGGQPEAIGGTSALMVLTHLAATLMAAVILASGERALWALLDWLRPALRVWTTPALVTQRVAPPRPAASARLPHQPPVLRSVRRRGPPPALLPATG